MAGCLLKGEVKTLGIAMELLKRNAKFFVGIAGLHLTHFEINYNETAHLYEIECYFGS